MVGAWLGGRTLCWQGDPFCFSRHQRGMLWPWVRAGLRPGLLAPTTASLSKGMEGKGLCSQPLLIPHPLHSPHAER